MTYDIYRYIFIGAAILAAAMFVLAVVLFFLLKIPKVVGDLSGATARKAIRQIREQNESSGDKGYQPSGYNRARGRLTDKISPSGNIQRSKTGNMAGHNTTKIATQTLAQEPAGETAVLAPETAEMGNQPFGETSVLAPETAEMGNQPAGETSVLEPETAQMGNQPFGETSVLEPETAQMSNQPFGETSVLGADMQTAQLGDQPAGVTTVLSADGQTGKLEGAPMAQTAVPETGVDFLVEYEITYVHSDEVIA